MGENVFDVLNWKLHEATQNSSIDTMVNTVSLPDERDLKHFSGSFIQIKTYQVPVHVAVMLIIS